MFPETAQKMEIHRKPRIWSHLLKKSLIENIFCAVGKLERIGNVVPVIIIHKKDSKRFTIKLVTYQSFPYT